MSRLFTQYAAHARHHRRSLRKGVAPIEFVMIIPVLVAFMMVTLWVVRVQDSVLQAGINAERAAAEAQVNLAQTDQLSATDAAQVASIAEITHMLQAFQPKLSAAAGLVDERGEFDSGKGVNGITSAAGKALEEVQMLAHSWESDVLEFPQSRSDQPELTLPKSVLGIAPSLTNLNAFQTLKSFGGSGSGSNSQAMGTALQNELNRSRAKIAAELRNVRSQISSLEKQLQSLEKQLPRDQAAIDRHRQELAKSKAEERRLISAQSAAQQVQIAF